MFVEALNVFKLCMLVSERALSSETRSKWVQKENEKVMTKNLHDISKEDAEARLQFYWVAKFEIFWIKFESYSSMPIASFLTATCMKAVQEAYRG